MSHTTRRWFQLALAAVAVLALSACSGGTVAMTPAPDARAVGCADVSVRLPDVLGEGTSTQLQQRPTNAQATGAWGNPAAVLLWCGVQAPGPTTQECVEVNGVDWIIDDSNAPKYRFTTFGREPTVTVVLDNTVVSGTTVITDLSQAVSVTQKIDQCLSLADVPTPTPTPSPTG